MTLMHITLAGLRWWWERTRCLLGRTPGDVRAELAQLLREYAAEIEAGLDRPAEVPRGPLFRQRYPDDNNE